MNVTTHERPGVYSVYGASSLVRGSGGRKTVGLAAVNTKAEAGVIQTITSYEEAVSTFGSQADSQDMAELIRGKVGRVYGDLMQLLTVMKGTPLAYNKDFQEDKESLFDAIDTWKATIDIFAKMLDKTEFRMDQIEKQLGKGFLNATDIAEHFAKQGIPFREAHAIVGHMVKVCEKKGCDLEDLTDEELQAIDKRVTKELLGDISIKSCVNARVSFGGTAPSEVHRQIEVGRQWLNSLER
mgnify:CR=1 FL=1